MRPGAIANLLQTRPQRVAPRDNFRARQRPELRTRSPPSPTPSVAAQKTQDRILERVVVATAYALEPGRLAYRQANLIDRAPDPIVRIRLRAEFTQRCDFSNAPIDSALPIEG